MQRQLPINVTDALAFGETNCTMVGMNSLKRPPENHFFGI
jgi:hypothetical protein